MRDEDMRSLIRRLKHCTKQMLQMSPRLRVADDKVTGKCLWKAKITLS